MRAAFFGVTSGTRRTCAWIGRAGYATCAAVYALVAVIALDAARRLDRREPRGPVGALHRLAEHPYGRVLLVLFAVGLCAQAVWRGVQALGDVEHPHGRVPKWWMRVGFALVGVAYVPIIARAFAIVFAVQRHAGATRSRVALVLAHPAGRALVFAIGGGLVVWAVIELWKAWRATFLDALDRDAVATPRRRAVVAAVGRIGTAGRALVFGAGGLMLARSAFRARADTVGTGDILRHLFAAPFGQPLVAAAALGLLAYAAFMTLQATWRKSVQL